MLSGNGYSEYFLFPCFGGRGYFCREQTQRLTMEEKKEEYCLLCSIKIPFLTQLLVFQPEQFTERKKVRAPIFMNAVLPLQSLPLKSLKKALFFLSWPLLIAIWSLQESA